MIIVACVKAKPGYSADYVNALHDGVKRNLHVEHRFICFTDDDRHIKCYCKKLPAGLSGWWAKLALFRSGALDGRVLYLDLDTIIVDSLDFIASYSGDFAILRDFYRPDGYGSGVMLWNKPQPQVWDDWVKEKRPNHPLGDQGWMEQKVPDADRLQDVFPGKIVSFKADCEEAIPSGASIVCFHGEPKPHQLDPEYSVDNLLLQHWVGEIRQETLH